MSVRWYVAYSLIYRNIEELLKERGVNVDHATIQRWVVKYSPELESVFRQKHKERTGSSWRMDETYVKVKGKWRYLYRAVDKEGNTIDFLLSKKRDKKAALRFFKKAIGSSGFPSKITIDKSGANIAALNELSVLLLLSGMWKFLFEMRQIKYLNNIIEQDHRGIKRIINPMLGFKSFDAAEATIAGIELHRMLKKGQMKNAENLPVWKQFYMLAA